MTLEVPLIKLQDACSLLREFEVRLTPARPRATGLPQVRQLLHEFERRHRYWEKRQVFSAGSFNLLRTMRLTTKELCHSNILAWILDHRLGAFGTHAQGKLGLELFLAAVGLPTGLARTDYCVCREVPGRLSQLDIVVEAKRRFVIGIENKIESSEILGEQDGEHQTEREWEDLQSRGKKLNVPPDWVKGFYLTPTGEPARSEQFTPISWRLIADVFEAFAKAAKARMVQLFAQHYAETLRRDVVAETETQEKEYEYR